MSKEEMVKKLGIEKLPGYRAHDYALPHPWCEDVLEKTGHWPPDVMIWLYDEKAPIFGRPYPLNILGWVILRMINVKW